MALFRVRVQHPELARGGVMADALVYGYTHHPAPFSADALPLPAPSGVEDVEEPAGPDHDGSKGFDPPSEFAIRCDKCDGSIGCFRHDIDERVVAASLGVQDRDAISGATRHALTGLAFEHHDDRLVNSSRLDCRSQLVHEGSGRSCSVPPPTSWTRSDHIGRVNEKHGSV